MLQPFEEVWSKLNKWIPRTGPLKGVEVASVGSFLRKAGFARKHASEKVSCWRSGGIAGNEGLGVSGLPSNVMMQPCLCTRL